MIRRAPWAFLAALLLGASSHGTLIMQSGPKLHQSEEPGEQSVLEAFAASLADDASAEFTGTRNNLSVTFEDVQWQPAVAFYDPIRREIQYMGKPQSGSSTRFTHYIYSEDGDSWTITEPENAGLEGTGHIWSANFDPASGDYYHIQYQNDDVFRYTHSTGLWSLIFTLPSDATGGDGTHNPGPWPGTAWHPHLFGTDDPGWLVRGTHGVYAWRKADDSFRELTPTTGTYEGRSGGDYVYMANANEVVFGSGYIPSGTPNLIAVGAGTPGSPPGWTVRNSSLPINVMGRSQATSGKMVVHPRDPDVIMILEEDDFDNVGDGANSARWWLSFDNGATFAEQASPHPLRLGIGGAPWENWTLCTIPDYDVLLAISSGHTNNPEGFRWRMWKPPVPTP